MDMMNNAEKNFHDIWMMNEDECHKLATTILECDKVLGEQHLGEGDWEKPENANHILCHVDPFEMEGEEKIIASATASGTAKKTAAAAAAAGATANAAAEGNGDQWQRGSKELFQGLSPATQQALIRRICEESGFLVEDRIKKIIASKSDQDQDLVSFDAVFEALGVTSASEVKVLTNYFLKCGGGPVCPPAALEQDVGRCANEDSDKDETSLDGDDVEAEPVYDTFWDQEIKTNWVNDNDNASPSHRRDLIDDSKLYGQEVNSNLSHIHIELDTCSTDTPSSTLSWQHPDEFDTKAETSLWYTR